MLLIQLCFSELIFIILRNNKTQMQVQKEVYVHIFVIHAL